MSNSAASVPIWRGSLAPGRALGLVLGLAAAFAAMRAAGMLGPAAVRWMLPLGFVLMMAMPWLILNKTGRLQIGLRKPASWADYPPAVLAGALAALACGVAGVLLFGRSADNWYLSVAANYRGIMDTSRYGIVQLHLIFTLPALVFSPVGEEIFFRGLLQRALEQRLSVKLATALECAVFGLVHLCHHGLVMGVGGVTLRPLSGALWVLLMFAVACMFAALRKRSASLFPAMAAHAAFNAAMNAVIFAFLWN